MVVFTLSDGQSDKVEMRLGQLGIRNQRFALRSVQDLGHDSAELIYLVPFSALGGANWPQFRVRLAQANRYFIVVGEILSSADIMNAARDGAFDVLVLSDTDSRWKTAMAKVADSQKLWLQLYGGSALKSPE